MEEKSFKAKVLSGVIWRFGERICAQLVTFIVSIVLARLLSPTDYGVISLITIFITVANVFVTDGFGKALIQKKDADNKDFSTVFYFNIFFSWLVYGLIFVVAPFVAAFYKEPILGPVLRVLALKIPIAGINSIQQAYVSRNMLFKRFFWSTIIGTVISAFVGIIMALKGYGVWALVVQYLSNSLIDTMVLWNTVKWRPQLVFEFSRLKDLLQFGWKILLTSLINSVYDNLRSLIIGKRYTSADLAYYTKGIHYPNLIIVNVNTAISSVLFSAMSKLQNDKEKLKQNLRRSISLSTYVIFPLMMGLAAIAPALIKYMLTDKWLLCVPFLRIACVYLALYPINIANLQAIMAVGRSDLFLKLNIIKKAIGIICILVSAPFGVYAMAGSEIVVGLAAVFTNVSTNMKLFQYSLTDLLKDIEKNLIMAVLMYGSIIIFGEIITNIITSEIVILLCQVCLGVLVYLVLSLVFKSKEFSSILGIVKEKIR